MSSKPETRLLTQTLSSSSASVRNDGASNGQLLNDIGGQIKPEIRQRILEVALILQNDHLSAEKKGFEVFQLYTNANASLTSDLAFILPGAQQIIESQLSKQNFITKTALENECGLAVIVVKNLPKMMVDSLSTHAMVLNLILNSILNGEHHDSCEVLHFISKQERVPYSKATVKDLNTAYSFLLSKQSLSDQEKKFLGSKLSEICIIFAANFGRPLLAALLLSRCLVQSVYIEPSTIKEVLMVLSINHPMMGNYQHYTLMKLLSKFEQKNVLELSFYLRLISNMCKDARDPYFANILFIYAFKNSKILSDDNFEDISPLEGLIEANLNAGNVYRAQELWKLCYKHDNQFAFRNTALFKRIFFVSEEFEKSLLLNDYLPEELIKNPDIFYVALAFYGSRSETSPEFLKLSKSIKPPINRPVLSSLLSSFLVLDLKNEISLVYKAITKSQGGLLPLDIDALVKYNLEKGNFGEAFKVVFTNNISATKKSHVTLIKYILDQSLEGKIHTLAVDDPLLGKVQTILASSYPDILRKASALGVHDRRQNLKSNHILNFLAINLKNSGDDKSVLSELTLVLAEYLGKKDGCGVSRNFFMNRLKQIGREGYPFDFVRFGLPKVFIHLVRFNETNRIKCLLIILQQARKDNNVSSIEWCLTELQNAGFLAEDIQDCCFGDLQEIQGIEARSS